MLTTLDVAKGMQRKHSKLMRDIDRVRSILPPDFAATAFIPDARIDAAGNRQRFFHLTRNALPFLFMGASRKTRNPMDDRIHPNDEVNKKAGNLR